MRGVEQIPWLYDAICALAERRGLGRWRQWLTQGARGATLDLGCGTGRNLPLFPDLAFQRNVLLGMLGSHSRQILSHRSGYIRILSLA